MKFLWPFKKIDNFATIIGGGTPSTKIEDYFNGTIPWITPKDLSGYSFRYIERGALNLTEVGLKKSSAKILPRNSILFSSRAPIGYVAIAKNNISTNQGFRSLLCNEDLACPLYIYYVLKYFATHIASSASGSTFDEISGTQLSKFKLPFPPILIQKKIASILSGYDDFIENNINRIQMLEKIAQNLYCAWFINFHFPGCKNTHRYQFSLRKFPKKWKVIKISELLKKLPSKKKIKKRYYKDTGKIPIIDQSRKFIAGYTDDLKSVYDDNLPLIIFGDHTRIIKYVDFPFARGADGTQILCSNDKKIPNIFLYYILLNNQIKNEFYSRHYKFLKKKEILLPTYDLIGKFVEFIEPIRNKISILQKKNNYLKNIRNLISLKLISGEINVSNFDVKLNNKVT